MNKSLRLIKKKWKTYSYWMERARGTASCHVAAETRTFLAADKKYLKDFYIVVIFVSHFIKLHCAKSFPFSKIHHYKRVFPHSINVFHVYLANSTRDESWKISETHLTNNNFSLSLVSPHHLILPRLTPGIMFYWLLLSPPKIPISHFLVCWNF